MNLRFRVYLLAAACLWILDEEELKVAKNRIKQMNISKCFRNDQNKQLKRECLHASAACRDTVHPDPIVDYSPPATHKCRRILCLSSTVAGCADSLQRDILQRSFAISRRSLWELAQERLRVPRTSLSTFLVTEAFGFRCFVCSHSKGWSLLHLTILLHKMNSSRGAFFIQY